LFIHLFSLIKLTLISLLFTASVAAVAQDKNNSEAKIKAALIYNILHFIEWPSNDLTICVYGTDDNYISSFDVMPASTKTAKSLEIQYLEANDKLDDLKNCQVIYLTNKVGSNSREILSYIKSNHILTFGESNNFIKNGGMVNFIIKDSKVKFEINMDALEQENLKVSAQVLRIADKVYRDER